MANEFWTVLIVDDEKDVHEVSSMVLEDFEYQKKGLRILSAYSAEEAQLIFNNEPEIALAIIDVVMETEHAGLDLVKFIREELKNHDTRVVLRTGNPGAAPPLDIMRHMEVDDYREKTEMTSERLEITVLAELRAYRNIKASGSKSRFLSNMSHEVRTPLNAIIGLSSLLLKTELNSRQKDYLQKIEKSGRHLLRVVNDILDFSKIESGKMKIELMEFSLENLLADVTSMLSQKAQEKGLEVIVDVSNEIGKNYIGDRHRLAQILINFLSNAIKFTEQGQIFIGVGKEYRQSDGKELLKFTVEDTGIGLDNYQIARLFQEFEQGDSSLSRQYGGTGLGLAISKKLAQLMGGDVGVTSTLGSGSKFWFTSLIQPNDQLNTTEKVVAKHLWGKRILVADDNQLSKSILARMLEQLNFDVTTAEDGEQAVAKAIASEDDGSPFDIVFLDWKMPKMDGIACARQIKAATTNTHLRVVFVTGANLSELELEIDEGEFDGILTKPVSFEQLRDSVMEQLYKSDQISTQKHSAQNPKSPEKDGEIENSRVLTGANILLVDDDRLYREICKTLLESAGANCQSAVNGVDALQKMSTGSYDIVLMDINMPVMDGHAAVRTIRQNPVNQDLPIIAITAATMIDGDASWIASGFSDVLNKPIVPDTLYECIRKWLPSPHLQGIRSQGRESGRQSLNEPGVAAGIDEIIGSLVRMLREGDFESSMIFENNAGILKSVLGGKYVSVQNAIQNFEYEAAAKILENISLA